MLSNDNNLVLIAKSRDELFTSRLVQECMSRVVVVIKPRCSGCKFFDVNCVEVWKSLRWTNKTVCFEMIPSCC